MLRILIFYVLIFFSTNSYGQFYYELTSQIEVFHGQKLTKPWAGGLNSAQVGTIDLNLDGLEDLVIFDRTSYKLNTYINTGTSYEYAPEYEQMFPPEITGWIIFADYNCNGLKDLFTHTIFGIKVYKNISEDYLDWELVADPIYTSGSSGEFNLQVNISDIPVISDIDNDGDLDILVYNFATGGYIRHHKNFSVENTGQCGLNFTLESMEWGGFEECECDIFAFNGNRCSGVDHAGGRVMHAGGKSMLLIDMNGNQVKDLIMSQEDCEKLYFLPNQGTPNEAIMNNFDMNFPDTEHPAHFPIFPAAFHEDVTHDKLRDLLVSPNISVDPANQVDFKKSLWLYKNTGSDTQKTFTYQKNNFLQEEMIDAGWMAKPFFADYDGDGDQDMFLAANGFEIDDVFYGSITLYENTGTPAIPVFKKITDDFLGLSAQKWVDMKPLFSDLNRDGAPDLVIPARVKASRKSAIFFLLNKNTSGGYEFDPSDIRELDFTFTSEDNICIFDVNQNGHPDILVGKSTGRIELFENSGNLTYTRTTQEFAGVVDNYTRRSPSMLLADLNRDGKNELVILDNSGVLKVIENYNSGQPIVHTQILYNPLLEEMSVTRFGLNSQLALAPVYKDSPPLLAVGSNQGGVFLLHNTEQAIVPRSIDIKVYPNPADLTMTVFVEISENANVQLISVLGQVISSKYIRKNEIMEIDPNLLPPGIYLIRAVVSKKNSKTAKLLIIK